MSKEDARLTRARDAGINVKGLNLDPNYGQAGLQERADRVAELGVVSNDGPHDGPPEDVVLEAGPGEAAPTEGESSEGSFDNSVTREDVSQ